MPGNARPRMLTMYAKNGDEQVKLSDFQPIKVIGRGAFGKVYLVELKSTKEILAMKVLKKYEMLKKKGALEAA